MSQLLGAFALVLVLAVAGGLPAAPAAAYTISLTGVDDSKLRGLLEATSTLVQLKDEPPPSPAGLQRRADADQLRLDAALRSEGFYDAAIDIALGPNGAAPGPEVTIRITPGAVYRFAPVTLTAAPGTVLPETVLDNAALGLGLGARGRAPLVVQAEQRLKDALGRKGFAFAKIAQRQVICDRDAKTLTVNFTVDTGSLIRLGRLTIVGLETVDPALVQGRVAWTVGALFRPDLIEKTRAGLVRLNVFATVGLQVAESADADGSHPVIATLTERKRHLVGLGATFANTEGLGGQAYWGHRNLFGGAEQLRLGAEISRLSPRTLTHVGLENADEKLSAEMRKPDFWAVNQDLVVTATGINEHPQAYHRQAITTQARLENRLSPTLTLGYGLAGDQSNIRDTARYTTATLAGTPLALAYDTTDAVLDPTTGYRLALEATPWLRVGEAGHSFAVSRITQSAYHDFSGNGAAVAAGRLSVGSILNGSTADLPADKRFFAGGGGSVRGYAYQKVGPLNAAGDPLGGRSMVEASAELRVKVTENIGLVPFLDGGNVYSEALPQLGESLRFGTGLGVRYYTNFGPLRLDIGVPLQARQTDEAYQVYLSLGQAF